MYSNAMEVDIFQDKVSFVNIAQNFRISVSI